MKNIRDDIKDGVIFFRKQLTERTIKKRGTLIYRYLNQEIRQKIGLEITMRTRKNDDVRNNMPGVEEEIEADKIYDVGSDD